jgi:hypothetical protein
MQSDLDKDLKILFEEHTQALPEEPFVSQTLRMLKRRQSLLRFMQRLILVLGLACFAYLSPFLIKGSILLTNVLNSFFELTGDHLATPAGMLLAGAAALSFLLLKRRLVI